MAKVFGVEQLQEKVRLTFERAVYSNEFLSRLGKLTRDRIYAITKTGNSMAGGEKKKLKPLSPNYKAYRKGYQEKYPTGPLFSPNRSNLTLTGQMLEALSYRLTQARRGFEIFVTDSLRNDPTGKNPNLTNAEVASKVAEDGRPFLGLDGPALQRIRNEIVKDVRKALRVGGLRK